MTKINHIPSGTIFKTNGGSNLVVIRYITAKEIVVQFEDKLTEPFKAHIGNLRKGKYRNPFDRTISSVGFVGIGKYSKHSHEKFYVMWTGMLCRCYSKLEQEQRPSTIDLICCPSWHNFQNFCSWCDDLGVEITNNMELDKDLLIEYNNVYSPDTCTIIPRDINIRLPKRYSKSNRVYFYPDKNLFKAFVSDINNVRSVIAHPSEQVVQNMREVFMQEVFDGFITKYSNVLTPRAKKALSNFYSRPKNIEESKLFYKEFNK